MVNSLFIQVVLLALICSFAAAYNVNCGDNHKAYVWNCQTLLDNWTLDPNNEYGVYSNCKWIGITRVGTTACKLLENDSCTVVISGTGNAAYSGAEIRQFVQDSMNQCSGDDEVSAHYTDIAKGSLCLCNHDTASSCF